MRILRSFYIHNRFFWYIAILAACFVISYWVPSLYPIAWLFVYGLLALFFLDCYLLFATGEAIRAQRELPQKLSNSDANLLAVQLTSKYPFKTGIVVIDELPVQFQKRDFAYRTFLNKNENHTFDYSVRPVERGEYVFGNLNVYASSPLQMVKRRFVFQKDQMVPVYPSIIQMQQYDFLAINNRLSEIGLK
ncbi:MAG: DUF58 domain-containing protein, partial [Allomuricauda sp.]